MTTPMGIVLVVSFGILIISILAERVYRLYKGKPVSRPHHRRPSKCYSVARTLTVLAAFAFSFAYLELTLCCLVNLKAEDELGGIAALPLLVFASLPFLVLSLYYAWRLKDRVELMKVQVQDAKQLKQEQEKKRELQS